MHTDESESASMLITSWTVIFADVSPTAAQRPRAAPPSWFALGPRSSIGPAACRIQVIVTDRVIRVIDPAGKRVEFGSD